MQLFVVNDSGLILSRCCPCAIDQPRSLPCSSKRHRILQALKQCLSQLRLQLRLPRPPLAPPRPPPHSPTHCPRAAQTGATSAKASSTWCSRTHMRRRRQLRPRRQRSNSARSSNNNRSGQMRPCLMRWSATSRLQHAIVSDTAVGCATPEASFPLSCEWLNCCYVGCLLSV